MYSFAILICTHTLTPYTSTPYAPISYTGSGLSQEYIYRNDDTSDSKALAAPKFILAKACGLQAAVSVYVCVYVVCVRVFSVCIHVYVNMRICEYANIIIYVCYSLICMYISDAK